MREPLCFGWKEVYSEVSIDLQCEKLRDKRYFENQGSCVPSFSGSCRQNEISKDAEKEREQIGWEFAVEILFFFPCEIVNEFRNKGSSW